MEWRGVRVRNRETELVCLSYACLSWRGWVVFQAKEEAEEAACALRGELQAAQRDNGKLVSFSDVHACARASTTGEHLSFPPMHRSSVCGLPSCTALTRLACPLSLASHMRAPTHASVRACSTRRYPRLLTR